MSKTFAKKFPTFWTGATARQLAGTGPYAKLIADYLFTSPAAVAGGDNYGVYYIERDTIMRHIEVDAATLDAVVELLAKLHVAFYDVETEWVFVREAAAWQYGTPLLPRDFNCNNARRFYKGLPKNPWLAAWFDRYVEDLHLQHNEETPGQWVDRREWTGPMPEISQYLHTPHPRHTAVVTPPKPKSKPPATKRVETPAVRERLLIGLRSMKMNGAIGGAVKVAITQVEQGDVDMAAIERRLLDTIIAELGSQVEDVARVDVEPFKGRMPKPEFDKAIAAARDAAARRLLNLPAFQE